MKANINKVKKKEMDLSSSMMDIYIKDNGIKIKKMDQEKLLIKMAKSLKKDIG